MCKGQQISVKSVVPALMLLIVLTAGCAWYSSSGFAVAEKPIPAMPEDLPEAVIVAPFSGDFRVARMAANQFTEGLLSLGFKPVDIEKSGLRKILPEHPAIDVFDSTLLRALVERIEVEGIFTGNIANPTSRMRARSELKVKLIDIQTGEILWSANVGDPRMFSRDRTAQNSSKRAVTKALNLLDDDLKRYRRYLEKLAASQANLEGEAQE